MNEAVSTVRDSKGYRALVATGLVSYGLVHLLIALAAIQVATGGGGDASSSGALKEIAARPLGRVAIWAIAVGLLTLVLWQAIEVVVGRTAESGRKAVYKRISSAGRAITYLSLGLLAVGLGLGTSSGSGDTEETVSSRLLAVPFGRFLVAAVGLGVAAVGVSQIVRGVRSKFTDDLVSPSRTTLRLGQIGYSAKGLVLMMVGALFVLAGLRHDPDQAGGMDSALSALRDQPFGPFLLAIMAVGIAAFGVYCFLWARRPKV